MALRKVQSGVIADNAITSDKIAAGAVTASDIAAGAAVPTQTGNAGKYLKTDGTTSSWETVPVPTPTAVSDQDNTSTGYLDLPSGTTAQRPGTPTQGMIRYNTTLGLAEQYTALGWQSIDSPPVVTSFSGTINTDTNSTITVTGSNFRSGAIVYIEGAAVSNTSRSLTTTYISSTQLTAATNAGSVNYIGGAAYDIKVINPSGLSSVLGAAGIVDRDPIWSTAAGNLATINDAYGSYSPITTLSASDPDGTSISYAITSGSLPGNVTLNTSTGAISGDPDNVVNSTTYTFEVTASSNSQSVPRTFNIIVNPIADGSSSTRAATSALSLYDLGFRTDGVYWINANGTPTQLHCLLSNTFVGGFYGATSSKSGWTQFAQRVNSIGDINIQSNTGTPDTNGSSNWALSTFKQNFDTGASFSTETEVLIDIDGTHTFIYDGWRQISRSLSNSQIDILRGYTGSYSFLSESTWNTTTRTGNDPDAGCSSCFRPKYKNFNADYAYVQTQEMVNSHSGTPCSDWCGSGFGKSYTSRISPTIYKAGGCYSGGGDPCSDQSVGQIGSVAKFYFRQRPV